MKEIASDFASLVALTLFCAMAWVWCAILAS